VSTSTALLSVRDLVVAYGSIEAVHGASLDVAQGEIVTLIGANGAGKSTVLKAILGLQPARSGAITFCGRDLTRARPDEIVTAGIALVPEGRGILRDMTVLENLELGAYHRTDDLRPMLGELYREFPILGERRQQRAGLLSGGQQQMLAIGRALMAAPRLVMLDEPSLGLAPIVVQQLFATLTQLNARGHTILLAEQNARRALEIAHRGYVFDNGRVVFEGATKHLLADDSIRRAYLGG
jgi:branched-chain amino acid transport system ATP-binding protein